MIYIWQVQYKLRYLGSLALPLFGTIIILKIQNIHAVARLQTYVAGWHISYKSIHLIVYLRYWIHLLVERNYQTWGYHYLSVKYWAFQLQLRFQLYLILHQVHWKQFSFFLKGLKLQDIKNKIWFSFVQSLIEKK